MAPSAVATVVVDGLQLSLEDVALVARSPAPVQLAHDALERLEASHAIVTRIVEEQRPVYGVTTGFGSLSNHSIPRDRASELQANLLRSHAAGVGEPFPPEIVRAALLLRANSLAVGYSGVRPVVVERLLDFLNLGLLPVVPSQGSVGASGDLAPLAHLALPLIGEGFLDTRQGRLPAAEALDAHGLEPLTLGPKEALALINGTQIIAANAVLALLDAEQLLQSATTVAAMSLTALGARHEPFDDRVQAARPHPGQRQIAASIRRLYPVGGRHVSASGRIQDPYSLRCIPQIHGAVLDALRPVRDTLAIEINSATDNPLVMPGPEEDVISGGNFHGHPLALACDAAKIAVASLGTISERRINLLVDGADRGLPPCLVAEPGLNSGYMIAHYASASLVAENRVLAHPSSVDSIPTSAGIEDVNTMGATASRHFRDIVANVETIVAIEALCAAQACDLAHRVPSGPLAAIHARIRAQIPLLERDNRVVSNDIAAARLLLQSGALLEKEAINAG